MDGATRFSPKPPAVIPHHLVFERFPRYPPCPFEFVEIQQREPILGNRSGSPPLPLTASTRP